jgi:hypothetical protein
MTQKNRLFFLNDELNSQAALSFSLVGGNIAQHA